VVPDLAVKLHEIAAQHDATCLLSGTLKRRRRRYKLTILLWSVNGSQIGGLTFFLGKEPVLDEESLERIEAELLSQFTEQGRDQQRTRNLTFSGTRASTKHGEGNETTELASTNKEIERLNQELTKLQDAVSKANRSSLTVNALLAAEYNLFLFDEGSKKRGGDIGLGFLALHLAGQHEKFSFKLRYRFLASQNFLRTGSVGYQASDSWKIDIGFPTAPFGLRNGSTTGWHGGLHWIAGYEQDSDTGIVTTYSANGLSLHLGLFKTDELGKNALSNRWASDVVSLDVDEDGELEFSDQEENQGNIQIAYGSDSGDFEVGFSAQAGQLYNRGSNETGHRWAIAVHAIAKMGHLETKFQAMKFVNRPKHSSNEAPANQIAMGFFGSKFVMASRGTILVGSLAYDLSMDLEFIQLLTLYTDASHFIKDIEGSSSSTYATVGCRLVGKRTFAYLELNHARNHPFFGGALYEALVNGPNPEWSRFVTFVGGATF
tara:strand:- start:139966 stop:141432 length:1467 start_codon:yes stop_codon:yes gene_type:complete